jgi:hypothetical protein
MTKTPMNPVRLLKTLALAAFAASNFSSSATPVTYWFSGVVDSFANASNTAPTGVAVGTPFVGRIRYDPAGVWHAETNNSSGGVYSQYLYADLAAFSFTVYIAGHSISNTVSLGRSGQIGLENNVSGRDYYYAETGSMLMMNGTNMVAAPNQASMSVGLFDNNATALASTALPLAPPVLTQFSEGAYLNISARNSRGSVDLCYVSGPISEISTNEIVVLSFRRLNSSTAQVAWPLRVNGYTLQATASLASPNWQNVLTPVVDIGPEHTVNVSTIGSPKFFRLKK